jgi:hypothetical protein
MAVEQRANIKFCLKLGKTAEEAYEMMKSVYGSDCLSRSNIFRWYAYFVTAGRILKTLHVHQSREQVALKKM